MRKSVIGILIAIGLLLAIAIPAAAITYGTPDTTIRMLISLDSSMKAATGFGGAPAP